jgi:hypothetical protein
MKKNEKGFGLIEGLLFIIAVSIVSAASFYVYNANKSEELKQSKAENTKTGNKVKKPDLPELVEYPEEIYIQSKQDIVKLKDASDSFKSFIGSMVGDKPKYAEECDYPHTVYVNKIYKDQFALGGQHSCGGFAIVWKKTNNSWSEYTTGQGTPRCSDLKAKGIPSKIIDKCYDGTGDGSAGSLADNPVQ